MTPQTANNYIWTVVFMQLLKRSVNDGDNLGSGQVVYNTAYVYGKWC